MSAKAIATAAALALAAIGALTGTASAAAQADTTPFSATYTATYFTGTITWANRSVSVDGMLRALPGSCRRAYAYTYDGHGTLLDHRSTSTVCTGPVPEHIPLQANVVGGAGHVEIILTDANASALRHLSCTRTECVVLPF